MTREQAMTTYDLIERPTIETFENEIASSLVVNGRVIMLDTYKLLDHTWALRLREALGLVEGTRHPTSLITN